MEQIIADNSNRITQPKSMLLSLPAEIRNNILGYLFLSLSQRLRHAENKPGSEEGSTLVRHLSIMFSCKQLQRETMPYFLHHALFNVVGWSDGYISFPPALRTLEGVQSIAMQRKSDRETSRNFAVTREVTWALFDPSLTTFRNLAVLHELTNSESRVGLFRTDFYYQNQFDDILRQFYNQSKVKTSMLFMVELKTSAPIADRPPFRNTDFQAFLDRADPYTVRLTNIMIKRGAKLLDMSASHLETITIEQHDVPSEIEASCQDSWSPPVSEINLTGQDRTSCFISDAKVVK